MKRAVVLLMAIVMIFNTMIIFASAENISFNNGQITTNSDDIGTISSIFYSEKEKKININGTVAHNTMVSRNEDKLEVYRVPIGKTLEEERALGRKDIDSKYFDTVSYSNSFVEKISEDTLLLHYTNLKFDEGDGVMHKAGFVKKITVKKL